MQNKKIKIKLNVVIDGKSILGMYALDLSQDIYVKIISDDIAECRKFEAEMVEHFQ